MERLAPCFEQPKNPLLPIWRLLSSGLPSFQIETPRRRERRGLRREKLEGFGAQGISV